MPASIVPSVWSRPASVSACTVEPVAIQTITMPGSAVSGDLILGEPTHQFDCEAIAAIEAGSAAQDGALLVVSHDEAFRRARRITRWPALDEGVGGCGGFRSASRWPAIRRRRGWPA